MDEPTSQPLRAAGHKPKRAACWGEGIVIGQLLGYEPSSKHGANLAYVR